MPNVWKKVGGKMLEKITEVIQDLAESFKEKEYVCYYRTSMGFLEKVYLTKKELVKFINKHSTTELEAYKIKDELKIKREIYIEEDKQ